ncbi:MAG: DNA-3-methyladenine glycosylase [Gammaproteobacteria bacterium]
MKALPRDFYARDAVAVARDLLGKLLVHAADGVEQVGQIVEVEAYLGPHDKASHSSKGLTPRTRVMFGPPGHAYVYFIYGMHHCMNVVAEADGRAAAVLLRALEPVRGIESRSSGPALLCRAMGIDKRMNGHDLLSRDLYIAAPENDTPFRVARRRRIGVDYAGVWARRLLRFYISGNSYVSRR